MEYKVMNFDERENIAWITFNRPDAMNAINKRSIEEFYDIVNRCSTDKTIRAVVLTGSGDRAFCAGGDVAEFAETGEKLEMLVREMTGLLHTGISRLAWLRAPVIAAVNGVAAGAGLSFAACCDLAIAADHARFTSAYTQIGLTPDGSSTFFLTRLLGRRRVMEMYLTNRVLSAQEALDWGLVNRVVPAERVLPAALELAARIAENGPLGVATTKFLMRSTVMRGIEATQPLLAAELDRVFKSEDAAEGARAFAEKRTPQWRGR